MAKNMWVPIAVILILGMLGAIVYGVYNMKPTSQTTISSTATPGGQITPQGCNVNPTVVGYVTDELNAGTSVGTTNYYRLGSQYLGTTSPTVVGTSDILITNSSYLSKIVSGVPIGCGSNPLVANMLFYANASLTYYGDDGVSKLVWETANETLKSATGASYNWQFRFQGTDKKSSGKQLLVIELSVPANVSSIAVNNGAQSVTVPNGYSRQLTNGYAAAFLLPAVTGNTLATYNVQVNAATGKTIPGNVYTTVYAIQPFVETDGTFSDVGNAFDSLNAAKYHEAITKNFKVV